MTRQERNAEIAKNLCDSIRDEVVGKIESGKVPDHWDGHEIRALLAEKFIFEVTGQMRDKRTKRAKDFRNDVLVRNL